MILGKTQPIDRSLLLGSVGSYVRIRLRYTHDENLVIIRFMQGL